MINFKEIKDLIKLMDENNLSEVEIESDGTKIKLRKVPEGVVMETPKGGVPVAAPALIPSGVAAAGPTIKSPMVGTFYAAPAPDAEPYVKVGSRVAILPLRDTHDVPAVIVF